MRISRLIHTIGMNLQKTAGGRGRYLKKHNIMAGVGEGVIFQPRMIPLYPELIKIHNNVTIGAGVRLVTHDAIHKVLNRLNEGSFPEMIGCIEIMDNVFVGTNATIMPNVRIGSNVVIGANSLVNKDCEPNSVYAGSPARRVGSFEDLVRKRKAGNYATASKNQSLTQEEQAAAWAYFHKFREE